MTAIFYRDCESTSENGRFTLEARSPHNGTIDHRDGRKPSDDEFAFKYRQHQSEFRYRLLDNARRGVLGRLLGGGPRVVWERWQGREESPGELVVSDDGWSVIRTHGFSPEVIALSPDGRDVVRVRVTPANPDRVAPAPGGTPPVYFWPLEQMACSTAGNYWASHSWRYFFRHRGDPHFAWRTSWGQRLVIDLAQADAYLDGALPPELGDAVAAEEGRRATALLAELSARMGEVRPLLAGAGDGEDSDNQLLERVRLASAALHLAGVHRLRECVPYLREWEEFDVPSSSMGSTAMTGHWWLETQHYRPVAHHSLKLLGEVPRGFPTYHFVERTNEASVRFPVPECLPDRAERAAGLARPMSAEEVLRVGSRTSPEDVLRMLGAPDFVRRRSRQVGRVYVWPEDWEYDHRVDGYWRTLRLTWEERDGRGHLAAAEEVGPYWLDSDEREAEYLRF